MTGSETGVWLSPFGVQFVSEVGVSNGKLLFIHVVSHILNTFISTLIFTHSYLLNATYTSFPHPLLIEPQMKN
jgi:hypothetical protein